MLLFKRNQVIKDRIAAYLRVVTETLEVFDESMDYYLEHRIDEHFLTLVERIHRIESRADDLRRDIETELYRKSLLPEVREDIMLVIEKMDHVPNRAEKIMRRITTHNIILPSELDEQVRELTRLGVVCCKRLEPAVLDVLGPCEQIQDIVAQIDTDESVADHVEHALIYRIFHSDYDPWDRLTYRDFVTWLAHLPDLAESISDNLTIFAIKRHA